MDQNTKSRPDILNQTDAISVVKDNKTSVDYFLFDTFEIHKNIVPEYLPLGKVDKKELKMEKIYLLGVFVFHK